MKKALVCLLLFAFSSSFSQTFTLSDTHFSLGNICIDRQIFFDLGKASLRPSCYPHLDSVASFLNMNSALKVEIGVHTDSRSGKQAEKMGQKLYEARAKSIVDYLIQKGIEQNRLVAKGYGCWKLLVSDAEISKLKTKAEIEAAHQKNRRVEFKLIASDKSFNVNDVKFQLGDYILNYTILFDLSKACIRPESKVIIDSIVNFMNKNTTVKFEIGVHVDYRGSDIANVKLTEARAKSVLDYMLSAGIDASRLTAVGYGESKPIKINSEDGKIITLSEIYINTVTKGKTKEEYEALMKLNRRVEFKIIAI